MKVQVHGGRCCGIKTIHGFNGKPDTFLGPKKAQKFDNYTDVHGNSVGRGYNWYRPKRPQETYLERFEEYIRYIKEHRPCGLIEITMLGRQLSTDDDFYCYGWQPVLDRHGFKKVSTFYNSNSSETVHVFHLVYGEPEDDCDDDYDDDIFYEED